MADLDHLFNRCGSCRYWSRYNLGSGHCELPSERNAPVGLTDGGGIETRIDFGCLWHDPDTPGQ